MSTHFLHTEADLDKALAQLLIADPRFQAVLEKSGRPSLRRRPAGFAGLCAIVVSQQLSTASAGAIWGRLAAAFDPFHHEPIRKARSDKLARIGLSRPKIKTMKTLSASVAKGDIDFAALGSMEADDAHNALTALHGIGPWTADIYLLFCLGHADAWPAGDLALQEAARMAFALRKRPTAKQMIALGERWRPWRGVAAHLLWAYYRAIKKRDAVPVAPTTPPKSPTRKKRNGGADGRRA
ncbi:MAG TPA: DNA-3-methyladenine glycosylase 2 family protein [Pseudolabrys sp.]|nr:DNA-3-methyladenine glycosylase 2 family protein [Pseudolabrys sp.]